MSKILTESDIFILRQKILETQAGHILQHQNMTEDIVAVFVNFYNSKKSYSEVIIDNGEIGKRCDLGYLHVFPRKNFRKSNIKPLRALVEHFEETGEGMTTIELSQLFPPKQSTDKFLYSTTAHFPELRFFNLIEGTTSKRNNDVYIPTSLAVLFLKNLSAIPMHVYTKKDENTGRVVTLPKDEWMQDCMEPEMKYCNEIPFIDESEPFIHVEQAVACH